jgi:hypothetical protein
MDIGLIIAELDMDIALLRNARATLVERQKQSIATATRMSHTKRVLSAEGKKNIAEGMKKHWAEQRAAAKKAKPAKRGKST